MELKESNVDKLRKDIKVVPVSGEWVILLDTETRGRLLKAEKISEGMLTVDGKNYDISKAIPLTIEQNGKLFNLYILRFDSVYPSLIHFPEIQEGQSLTPDLLTLINDSVILGRLLKRRKIKIDKTILLIIGVGLGLLVAALFGLFT